MEQPPDRPALPKSYKRKFPFRLCAPSFIYPDDYTVNVELLGPYLDEIELLFFESDRENSLPSSAVIRDLRALSERYDISYNIHLPIDIDPGSPVPEIRDQAVRCIRYICELTRPLSASSYTVHLPAEHATDLPVWRENVAGSMEQLIHREFPGRIFSVETLHYPLEWIEPVIQRLDLSVCLDIGHLMADGLLVASVFKQYAERIAVVHLHGVDGPRDHVGLGSLPRETLIAVIEMLERFSGTVSIEVFSYHHLRDSLRILEDLWFAKNPV
ncbi:MAG: cobamide remodeling phosphodiesterase CbiR [Thermodesulfobacteriota bacterium]